jgi:hypothetical protein
LANDKRFKVTTDSTKIPGNVTDYPVYVDLADLGSGHGFWTNVRSDGGDCRAYESDGTTQLPIDVIAIDTTAKTGQLRFKATGTLSSSTDTDFYIYYGDAALTADAEDATYGRENVWTNYGQVYAMEGASATAIIDRTSNDRDVTSDNNTPDYQQTGKLGKCVTFDDHAGVEYLNINTFTSSEYTTQLMFSCWAYFATSVTGNQRFFEVQYSGTSGFNFETIGDDYRAQIYISGTKSNYVADTLAADVWTHFATWWDGTTWRMFKNGSQTASTSQSGTASMSSSGTNQIADASLYLRNPTSLDMIVMSGNSNTISNDYISVIYNNENSPSTFYTLGAEEDVGGGAVFVPRTILM